MKYKLEDLINIKRFQRLQDRLNQIYCFPSSIIDNDGNILTATAWQEICVQFHRKNKEAEGVCIKSDQYIKDHIHRADPALSYRCPHGLVDNALPIIIDGVHYGNFFTGQFFLEEPDLEFFRTQARKYGFDEDAYLAAVKKVPIWTQAQLDHYLLFIKELIAIICESGLKKLKEVENQKQLRKKEERYRSILKAAMDGYWRTDTSGRLIEVNDAYCRMSGYREDELLSMHIADVEVVETPELVAEHMQKVILTGSDRFESKHRRKDGTTFDVEVGVQFHPEEEGHCVCFLRDISERKRAEQALREGRDLLDAAQRLANVGGWVWDVAGRTMTWTDQVYLIHGFGPGEVAPGSPEHIERSLCCYDPDDRPVIEAAFRRCAEQGIPYDLEFGFTTVDGRRRWIQTTAQAVMEGQKVVRVIGNIVDITDRKRAETERDKLQAQLTQAQKMESVGRLAGGVAHDYNNMLSVIIGNTELAMETTAADDPLYGTLEQILGAAGRSADITRQLLAFARKQTIAPKVLDLNHTVEGMLKMLRRLIGEDIDLAWLPEGTIWPVKMDPAQIDQILANLCVNARDAISGVGKITIETGKATLDEAYCAGHPGFIPGDFVLLSVSDDGCGMDKAILANLFEPFFTTKDVDKGTGLGLATVYGIVKQNEGFINVYSEPGQGTRFTIYLPRYQSAVPEPIRGTKPGPDLRGNETILLVEDEPAILKMITMMLERLGYTVLGAQTPAAAIELARGHRPASPSAPAGAGAIHLLITDVIMPEMNGRELAANLLLLYPDLKRLFMSGYTANVIAHHGILDEGVHFIQKPFAKQDLAVKVREVLDEVKQAPRQE